MSSGIQPLNALFYVTYYVYGRYGRPAEINYIATVLQYVKFYETRVVYVYVFTGYFKMPRVFNTGGACVCACVCVCFTEHAFCFCRLKILVKLQASLKTAAKSDLYTTETNTLTQYI